jgi:hypothetical protein
MATRNEEAWMAQWRSAERELAALNIRDLRRLTDEEALRASDALLSLATAVPLPPERLRSSGLVAQQALLHRLRA